MAKEVMIRKQHNQVRLFALMFLVIAPLIYGFIVYMQSKNVRPTQVGDLFTYAAFILAVIEALLVGIFDRTGVWNKIGNISQGRKSSSVQKALSIQIFRLAFLETIYIFGLVVFFLTGTADKLIYFAVLGIIASIIYWPTEARFNQLVQDLEGQ